MLSALPEKNMVFKGLVANKEDMNKLMLTPQIRYPLLGGSGLITFEKEEGKSDKSTATAVCPGPSALGPSLRPPWARAWSSVPSSVVQGYALSPKHWLPHVLCHSVLRAGS